MIKQIKMPDTHRGSVQRRVGARWLCTFGHLHPSPRHAGECNRRRMNQAHESALVYERLRKPFRAKGTS